MRSLSLLLLLALATPALAQDADGVLPVGKDGKALNLDFETGTLKDWTATGNAFVGQPVKGDTVQPRRGDSRSRHQGQYWIGGYEIKQDLPQGTLTSVAFAVTQPWASFLVGGGPHANTYVEIVRADTGKVVFRASGLEEEDMRRVAVDLRELQGQLIFIRIVDQHSGHWGHINFDDFRFHTAQPKVPARPSVAAADSFKFAGLPAEKAAQAMTVPEGFEVKLFAGEPDVVQPVALCLDDRGRVWVAEANSYPIRRAEGQGQDRILIFEDTDGDGKFDKRTVFMDGLNLVSGLEVGFGGVWIGAAPHLLFVPMKDDRPTGKPQVLLDGWGYQDTHETLNTFTWGPDGWLYGCHGVFTHSRVGKPGTPDADRVPINAGVWRYHPTRHVFEVFAHGTSNPWGLDFDEHGEAFVEACVIPHLYHIIQNGRYQRQAGAHFNPHTYADIGTIADHFHYLGGNPHGGNNRSGEAGGGHAHCGLLCYLGGAWPAEYRGRFLMGNIHGRRLNVDVPRAKGSGYTASHGPDFLLANDAWARFINLRTGPDGNIYLIDWYDKQACHHGDPKIWDRGNGRIYKISYRGTKSTPVDLAKCSDAELVKYQLHANDWYVRHARRLLQERRISDVRVLSDLIRILDEDLGGYKDETRRLRALWAVHVGNTLTPVLLEMGLADKGEHVRAWTIRLACEQGAPADAIADQIVTLAAKDPSPIVRRAVASNLAKLPPQQLWAAAAALLSHGEDADDPNLPLMYWYAIEPLAALDAARALDLAAASKLPQILPFMVRRIGSGAGAKELDLLIAAAAKSDDVGVQTTFLNGLAEALKGRPRVAMPKSWPTAFERLSRSPRAEVMRRAAALAVTFGDTKAFDQVRRRLATADADPAERQAALEVLLGAKDAGLPPVLHDLLAVPALRGPALRALASYDDAGTPKLVLDAYAALPAAEKRDALATLASRPTYARALLDAVAAKRVPAADVSAELVRQLRNLRDAQLDKHIAEVWGVIRETPAEKAKLIAHYRQLAQSPPPAPVDPAQGRALYVKTCQNCHTLFGEGGKVGPDLTGANRGSLDYLLENILDPSAVIPKEYAATVLELTTGRVVTGIVRSETPAALTVLTANETLTIPRDEVASRQPTPTSMMPDDLLRGLTEAQVRALLAYLQSPAQVGLPAGEEKKGR